jgi:hypothetical protein
MDDLADPSLATHNAIYSSCPAASVPQCFASANQSGPELVTMKNVSRRQYLHSLFADALAAIDALRGEPHFRLDEIGSLPDSVLRAMVPVAFQGTTLSVEDGWLLLRRSPDELLERQMPLSAPQIYAVDRFDGRHSIADICAETASAFDLSPDAAGDLVKSLFVALAGNGLCHPLDRPE